MLKCAVFVDFDNVFGSLARLNVEAAETFARDPQRWLSWIEGGMPTLSNYDYGDQLVQRRVLVRRCYLNPVSSRFGGFGRYRSSFSRCGFSVIDCPPLTKQGKNSADILLTIDVLDFINHPTRFDEFVIVSGDTDFTPLLSRLRAFDRRTAIVAGGHIAEAYTAVADRAAGPDLLIEHGLGIGLRTEDGSDVKAVAAFA